MSKLGLTLGVFYVSALRTEGKEYDAPSCVSFLLRTSQVRFTNWLKQFTSWFSYVPIGEYTFSLNPARPKHYGECSTWIMTGSCLFPGQEEPAENPPPDLAVMISFHITVLSDDPARIEVTSILREPWLMECYLEIIEKIRRLWPEAEDGVQEYLTDLACYFSERYPVARQLLAAHDQPHGDHPQGGRQQNAPAMEPEAKPQGRRGAFGTHGGTIGRVKEARSLIEKSECKKTEACKRAGIDTRTYDRYAFDIIDSNDGGDWDGQ